MIRRTAITLAGALLALAGIPALASAATRTVCASGCDYDTIQAAVTAAVDGDVIEVGAGTYPGATINKRVTIQGEGIAATTVQAATAFTLQAGGSGSTLRDMTVRGTTATGTSYGITAVTGAVDDITLANLTITNARWAIDVRNTATADGWTIENVTATGNNFGARFWGPTTNLVVENSHFDRNDYGLYSQYLSRSGTIGVPGLFDGIDVDGTTFNENSTKGIYLEAISNAVFSDVEIDASGTIPEIRPSGDPNYPRAGVDINAKYDDFANVSFIDTRVTNTLGTAMAIKGRNDAPSYADVPATLTNVTLSAMTVTGTTATEHPEALGHGIAFGYNVVNAQVTGSRIVDNEGGGVLSYVTSGSTIDATNNWWGCNAGPGAAGCDSATVEPGAAAITTDPRVVLGVSIPSLVFVGGTVPVTASVATNSAGGPVVGLPEQQVGLSATLGDLSTAGGLTSGGVLSGTYTGFTAGFASIAATLDNQTTTAGVTVFLPIQPSPTPQPEPITPPVLTTPPPDSAPSSEPSTDPTPAERAEEQATQILGGDAQPAGFRLRGLAEVFRPAGSRIELPRSRRTPVLAVGCGAVECQVAVKIVLRLRDGTRIVLPVQRGSASQGEAVPVTLRLTAKQRRQIRRAGGATMSVEVRVNGNGERERARGRLTIRV